MTPKNVLALLKKVRLNLAALSPRLLLSVVHSRRHRDSIPHSLVLTLPPLPHLHRLRPLSLFFCLFPSLFQLHLSLEGLSSGFSSIPLRNSLFPSYFYHVFFLSPSPCFALVFSEVKTRCVSGDAWKLGGAAESHWRQWAGLCGRVGVDYEAAEWGMFGDVE